MLIDRLGADDDAGVVSDTLIASEFAGYRVDSRIGRGGMGVVYAATDLSLDRPVALKVLAEELASDPAFRRRFVSESKLAASLDHPNVIPIHAAGEHDGILYIAMRLVPGDDLRTLVRRHERLEPGRAVRLIAQVASALDAAHAHGLVHRDVKPANVLVTPEDHVYLTDFGLSKRVDADSQATRTGMVLGTLDYIAPEQIRGDAIGPFTDIYSLGCLITHLLTGEVPFTVPTEEAKMWAHFSEPPPLPGARVPGLGSAFDQIVMRAMSKRPQDRYATAGEVGSRDPGRPPADAGATLRRAASGAAPAGAHRSVQRDDPGRARDRGRAARDRGADDPAGGAGVRRRRRPQLPGAQPMTALGDPPFRSSPAELEARLAAERRGTPFLFYREESGRQVIVELDALGARATVGRRPDNDIALAWDAEVSRVHAQLEQIGSDWALIDDGLSRNGSYVNGERVAGRRRLRDGDRLCFGETPIVFRAPEHESSLSTAVVHAGAGAIALTDTQRRLLVALCRPLKDSAYATPATNRDIAEEVHLSVNAVKAHLRVIFERLGIDDMAQNQKRARLAAIALVHGLVHQRDF